MKKFGTTTTLMALALIWACGSDDGDETGVECSAPLTQANACGGTLSGTWRISGACGTIGLAEAVGSDCPGLVEDEITVNNADGMFTFDGSTFSEELMADAATGLTIPNECLGSTSCAGLGALINAGFSDGSATCEASGDQCGCDITASLTSSSTGTFSVDGGVVSLVSDGDTDRFIYCVEGNQMQLRAVDDEAGVIGPTFVLTRQ